MTIDTSGSLVRDRSHVPLLSITPPLPRSILGSRPGTQYYVLLCDSNRHRVWTPETRERSCCSRNQRQLQRRWTPKGLHGILVQLQQLPSLPSLEWIKTNQVPDTRPRFRFSSSSPPTRVATSTSRKLRAIVLITSACCARVSRGQNTARDAYMAFLIDPHSWDPRERSKE